MSDRKTQVVTLEKKEKNRGRGRPQKIDIKPADAKVAQLMKDREDHLQNDDLLNKVRNNPDSFELIDLTLEELAKENAYLDFERKKAEREGEDTTGHSAKKINTLKATIDTYFRKRDSLIKESFDLRSEKAQKIFEFWIKKLKKVLDSSGLSKEQIQSIMQEAKDEFQGWEEDALQHLNEE